jgi:glycosyltransferase involved in cell wall biosynthesis
MSKLYFISHRISKVFTGGEFCSQLLLNGALKAGLRVECWEGDSYGSLKKNIVAMNIVYLFKTFAMESHSYLLLDMDFHVRYMPALLWARHIKKAKIVGLLFHYTYWDKYSFLSRTIHFVIERWVSKKCDFLITISKFAANNFRSLSLQDIPVFINTPFSREAEDFPKEIARFDPDCQRLLFVGSIERRKNVINIIKALPLLKSNVFLDIVGFFPSNDYLNSVNATIQSFGLEKNVILHGKISTDELLMKYSAATAFILVSRMEGYGMVYAEAMEFGLPIVATTRGAVPELVEDGVNGFLCDPDNVAQITDAINKLGNKETWERISANNLAKAKTLKSRSQFENESCEIFKNILKR